jgi:hypothetical protein
MGLVTRTYTYTAGNTINPTENNSNENTLYTLVNGNIDNDNIKTAAAIASTKIAIVDPSTNYAHTGTYDSLDDHISDAVAHGGGLSQMERFRYNVLTTGTSVVPRWYNKSGQTKTIEAVFVHVGTAPTGASLIVDVNKNGTTIFTTQDNRPTIAATETSDTSGTPDVTSVEDGDYLDFDIDQVGSTIPGADLLIVVYF